MSSVRMCGSHSHFPWLLSSRWGSTSELLAKGIVPKKSNLKVSACPLGPWQCICFQAISVLGALND